MRFKRQVIFVIAVAVFAAMYFTMGDATSPAHWIIAAIVSLDTGAMGRFALVLALLLFPLRWLVLTVIDRFDAHERQHLWGWELLDVHSSNDTSMLRRARERAGLQPVAIEVWRNPQTGETKRHTIFW